MIFILVYASVYALMLDLSHNRNLAESMDRLAVAHATETQALLHGMGLADIGTDKAPAAVYIAMAEGKKQSWIEFGKCTDSMCNPASKHSVWRAQLKRPLICIKKSCRGKAEVAAQRFYDQNQRNLSPQNEPRPEE